MSSSSQVVAKVSFTDDRRYRVVLKSNRFSMDLGVIDKSAQIWATAKRALADSGDDSDIHIEMPKPPWIADGEIVGVVTSGEMTIAKVSWFPGECGWYVVGPHVGGIVPTEALVLNPVLTEQQVQEVEDHVSRLRTRVAERMVVHELRRQGRQAP